MTSVESDWLKSLCPQTPSFSIGLFDTIHFSIQMSQEVEMSSIPKEADVAPQTTPEAIVSIPPPETKPEEETAAKEVVEEKKHPEKPNWCMRFLKRWFIDAFGGMALGLFCTLIAGLIVKQLGQLFQNNIVGRLLITLGQAASILTGCGIGAGIGYALGAPRLVVFCSLVAGFVGANANAIHNESFLVNGKITLAGPGDPISAYLSAIVATEIGILIAGKTSIDILLVPLVCLICGLVVAFFLGPPVAALLAAVGRGIELATTLQPVLMGMLVAAVMGFLLTMPTSSAAIGISINMAGISAAAASAGCACHMVGFAVSSFRENGWGGLIAQGIGTSMLQIPNVMKHPQILIPPTVAAIVAGPISSAAFKLLSNAAGSGMGTSGFVGVLMTYSESVKELGVGRTVGGLIVCFVVIPAVVSLGVSEFMRKKGWIKPGDMKINTN